MTDVQTDAGRIGEHVEDIALGPTAPARGAERSVLVPVALPAGLDLEMVVGHALLYRVAAGPPSPARFQFLASASKLLQIPGREEATD